MKLEDIARLANVSKSAVSLALNGKTGVSEETRLHILKIVEENNYIPLRNTNKKRQKKSVIRFIACKSPDLITDQYQTLPFFSELLSYLSAEITSYPYELIISTFDATTILEELAEAEKEQTSAGLILLGTNLGAEEISRVQQVYPKIVILDTHHPHIPANFVSINNFLGGYTAADYLLQLSHKKIGYVMGLPRIKNFEERKSGFFTRLKEAEITISKQHIFHLPAMQIQEDPSVKEAIAQLPELPSAIFCENDYMAISMIKMLQSQSIKVPEQISVLGFDNINESKVITPELTTVHVKKRDIAEQTLALLSKQIKADAKFETRQIQVNTSLIERTSCIPFQN
ncbi:LacI family DNA-binding transcriptional regulator [Listeria ivanovii]|uniref:Putative transcriptional regulator, LacI family n=1 Tax=Listeria ivanovii (strain ATCC BAA-678 / PAM 55) TaxID=881621 RepID=G2ZE88_LISIP|nr:LacI family DNA-binding transcriptional regulator [Listeria ivanovii]AHI55530.1 LacI family transcriptional regulator [Listeria ivanovii WSLC3009]AIS64985.1 LacI family transcriptional regulator [Listeria ivanovii subsp. ivanovii]MBC1758298.1 LacI family transcriptional regulator [Listeria ivanovii]MBK3913175.1 LacI family transcriptional regulator [Listeria ivanovii subsp. ivanovii]MBK3920708.1 LacI family transcriptional regulator [Listeria ivanovii subsp. ivanovii]